MKIAIAADGNGMNSIIPDQFEAGSYLLIYETDDGSAVSQLNPAFHRFGRRRKSFKRTAKPHLRQHRQACL